MNRIYFDGSTKLNCVMIYDKPNQVYKLKAFRDKFNSMELEWLAIIFALHYVIKVYRNNKQVSFHGDNNNLVGTLQHSSKPNRWQTNELRKEVKDLYIEFYGIDNNKYNNIRWISRDHNIAGILLDEFKERIK